MFTPIEEFSNDLRVSVHDLGPHSALSLCFLAVCPGCQAHEPLLARVVVDLVVKRKYAVDGIRWQWRQFQNGNQ